VDWVCASRDTASVVHVDDAMPSKPPGGLLPYPYIPNGGAPQVISTSATSGSVGCAGPPHGHPGSTSGDPTRFGCDVGILPAGGFAVIRFRLDTGGGQNLGNTVNVDTLNVIAESNESNNQVVKVNSNCC
jgi:hypothetical protein